MVRLSKLTDYGLVLMSCFARAKPEALRTARDLAEETQLPLPTVSKLLKELLQSGLLVSHRGIKGGYTLAKSPDQISLDEIIAALEGPVALTECSTEVSACDLEPCCLIKKNQQIINRVVRGVLAKVMLSDLNQTLQVNAIKDFVPAVGLTSGRVQ